MVSYGLWGFLRTPRTPNRILDECGSIPELSPNRTLARNGLMGRLGTNTIQQRLIAHKPTSAQAPRVGPLERYRSPGKPTRASLLCQNHVFLKQKGLSTAGADNQVLISSVFAGGLEHNRSPGRRKFVIAERRSRDGRLSDPPPPEARAAQMAADKQRALGYECNSARYTIPNQHTRSNEINDFPSLL